MAKVAHVRFDHEELQEVRNCVEARRAQLDKARAYLEKRKLSTYAPDVQIEILERVRIAIGDETQDMFGQEFDPETGEIKKE